MIKCPNCGHEIKEIRAKGAGNKIKDITGQRFGRLIVIGFHERRKKRTYWNCKCDCGKRKSIDGDGLKSGDVISCGCYKMEYLKRKFRNKKPLLFTSDENLETEFNGN